MRFAIWGHKDLTTTCPLYLFLMEKKAFYSKAALDQAVSSGAVVDYFHKDGWVVEVECTEDDLVRLALPNRSCNGWYTIT